MVAMFSLVSMPFLEHDATQTDLEDAIKATQASFVNP